MSSQALAAALDATLYGDLALCLIHLADSADETGVVVPHLPILAQRLNVDEDVLRRLLDTLTEDGILSPVHEHAFDFVARTEGFRINLDALTNQDVPESPIAGQLRRSE